MKAQNLASVVCFSLLGAAACELEDPDPPRGELRTAVMDFGDGPVEVRYRDEDGRAVVHGDMIVGTTEEVEAADIHRLAPLVPTESGHVLFSAIQTRAWPGGRIPYTILPDELDPGLEANVISAITKWNATGAVRFVLAGPGDTHILEIKAGDTSFVGRADVGYNRNDTRREMELGWGSSERLVMHELGHVMGLLHEHTRTDRDDHIVINTGNINPDYVDNFDMIAVGSKRNYRAYDIESIMHYSSTSFAANPAVLVIAKKGCGFSPLVPGCRVGPSNEPTVEDVRGVFRIHAGASVMLRNAYNERCMRPQSGSTQPGAKVVTDTCNGSRSRRWYLFDREGDGFLLVNEHSRLCLTGGGTNSNLVQSSCAAGNSFQRFDLVATNGGVQLRNQATNQCVRRISSQSQLRLAGCQDTSTRRWFTDPVNDE